MPWTGNDFQAHHNHHLGIAQAAHAASVANAILRRTGNEGLAIATANKGEKRDAGGGIAGTTDPSVSGIGGITPSSSTMEPYVQSLVQRYASMPPEKLQELSAMLGKSSPQGQIVQRLLMQKRMQPNAGAPQQPTQAAAPGQQAAGSVPSVARGGPIAHRDIGGGVSLSTADPWWTRQQAEGDMRSSGFLGGSTMGRADAVHTQAPGGAYVLPADVVSGLGEGNSLAGARVWQEILASGPHGIPEQRAGRAGRGPPEPPRLPQSYEAKGGGVQGKDTPGEPVPVALSHGEIAVFPADVAWFGGGDLKKGHRILDAWVQHERAKQIKILKALPGPVGAKKKTA